MAQEGFVRVGGSVVKLVDDDDVVRIGTKLPETLRVKRLNRREDVPTLARLVAPNELLSEVPVANGRPIPCEALVEDLLAMRHEQQGGITAHLLADARIVERRDDGLPRPRRCDDEILGVAVCPLERERIERGLLVWQRHEPDGLGERVARGVPPFRRLEEARAVVGLEGFVVLPVLLERDEKLVEDRPVVHGGQPNVPLAAVLHRGGRDRFEDPMSAVENPLSRRKSHAFAWRRVRRESYDTRTSAPRR